MRSAAPARCRASVHAYQPSFVYSAHVWQAPHITNKMCEQRRGIVHSPPRKEPNFSYRLLRIIYPVFRVLFPKQVIPADDLARAMVDVAVRETAERGGVVLENRDIRAMVKSL